MLSRRSMLKTLAAGAALPLLGRNAQAAEPTQPPARHHQFQLGVATVSLKALPLDNMLAAVRQVGFDQISLHKAHSPWENTPPAWQATAARIRAAAITPLCCGVLYLKNDEPAMRRMFEYARILGVGMFSCSPEPAALPLLERLVKEYDLRAAIHNHGPEDKIWPTAASVLAALANRDPRLGLCYDVGHSYRAGEDPAQTILRHHERILDLHLKDTVAAVGAEDIPVEMGRGRIDLPAVLAALTATEYRQAVWLEYEKDPSDPLVGLAESAGYVRGLLQSRITA
jgi:inosose dehydratase